MSIEKTKEIKKENRISIEGLMELNDDVCVVIPRSTFYFWVWHSNFTNNKEINNILNKYIEFEKIYEFVYTDDKSILGKYLIPLEETKKIIKSIKNITRQKFYLIEISESELQKLTIELNKLFIKKERIQQLKQKNFLSIEEKRELALAGEHVPVCVSDNKGDNIGRPYSTHIKKKIKL